jgi:hypothetical protein
MASSLPPNNGSAQVLKFKKVRTQSMRELIATGVLDDLEYGLLKGSSKGNSTNDKVMGWGVEDKGVLLDMEVDTLKAWQEGMEIEVQVRSLCYSRGVTADYLESYERFNMKPCVLVLGDLGRGAAPWSELVQPAVYLHRKEFNVIWVDVNAFSSNPQLWLKFGAILLSGLLKFLCIKQASVVCRGIGGAVFLEALAKSPDLFCRTHFIYNMDMPAGKGVHLPVFELEEVLRKRELQLWFAFRDDQTYDRFVDGTPQKAYDAVQKLQARLVGERQRGRRELNYDEILITENLNANPHLPHLQQISINIYTILVFSTPLLQSVAFLLKVAPGTHQDGMESGLVGDFRRLAHAQALEGNHDDSELMAVRRARIGGAHGLMDRKDKARSNMRRLENVNRATSQLQLALPDVQNGSFPGFSGELARRLENSGARSVSSSRTGSRGSRGGSRSDSRGGSRGGSRISTKEMEDRGSVMAPALPSLLRNSYSEPQLQALADEPANPDDDDDDPYLGPSSVSGRLETLLGDTVAGEQPWQAYRRMWQTMHGRKATGYTHPMKEL